MNSLIYVSRALAPFDREACEDLARTSAAANRVHALTGHLYHRDGRFLQYLEGPAARLDQLMDNIRRDERHDILLELTLAPRSTRRFPDWAMRHLDDDFVHRSGFEDAITRILLQRTEAGADLAELVATADRLSDELATAVATP